MRAYLQDTPEARWDDVRLFLAAWRAKTLGAAARQLQLDTSTLSRRLAAFENGLSKKLFDRSRDGLAITRAGRQLLPAAEAMEAAHARLTRDASNLEATAGGVVRVSAAPGMCDHFVAPLLSKLRAKHPGISLQLDGSTRPVDLGRHEADLALRSVEPKGAELLVTRLGSARWVPAGAPGFVAKLGSLRRWADASWITWDEGMAHFLPSQWLGRHAPGASIALATNLFTAQLIAAATGLGLVLAPETHLRQAGLIAVRTHRSLAADLDTLPIDHLWLVCHRSLREVPRVAAVWTFFAEELRQGLRAQPRGAAGRD